MTFPLTSLFAAALALLMVLLAFVTVIKRVKSGHSWGDGGDESLLQTIRAHGNLTEYAPIFLILLAMLESSGDNATVVGVLGAIFLFSRLLYVVYVFVRQALPLRIFGFWTSAGPIGVAAGWLIFTQI